MGVQRFRRELLRVVELLIYLWNIGVLDVILLAFTILILRKHISSSALRILLLLLTLARLIMLIADEAPPELLDFSVDPNAR